MKQITLWSPSNDGSDLSKESFNKGKENLYDWGYSINIPSEKIFEKTLTGITSKDTNKQILFDFNKSISSDILISIYGGYTTNLLIDELKSLNIKSSKLYCGKSDLTCLLNSMYTIFKYKSIYGIDFSKISNPYLKKNELDQIKQVLNKETTTFTKPSTYNDGYWYLYPPKNVKSNKWGIIGKTEFKKISGISVGGNLESLSTLIGTKYMPNFIDKIVLLDAVANVSSGRFIMDLKKIFMTTNINEAKAIVIGTFGPESILNNKEVISDIIINEIGIKNTTTIITNVDISHTEPSYPFYIGGNIEIDIKKNEFTISWD